MKFWESQAYEIANKVTAGHQLHFDLVSHVFLIMSKFTIEEKDLPRMFARFSFNQWNWKNSEFNKLFRNEFVELIDLVETNENEFVLNEFSKKLHEFLDIEHENEHDYFIKEITKMHLYGMTFREIKELTGISLDTIHKTIKQFKHDLHSYCAGDCESVNDVELA